MNTPLNKQIPTQDKQTKAVKEIEMIAKDKKNKKILESFKTMLLNNRTVTT